MSLEQHNDSLHRILMRDGYQKLARELQDEIGKQMSAGRNFNSFGSKLYEIRSYMDLAQAINVGLGLDCED